MATDTLIINDKFTVTETCRVAVDDIRGVPASLAVMTRLWEVDVS